MTKLSSLKKFWESLEEAYYTEKLFDGMYLKSPITQTDSMEDTNERLSYGVSSMQGWRISQEDAHISLLNFDKNTSLFAIFDGHNGDQVAKYASTHLPQFILNNENYKRGNIELALKEAFMDFDMSLISQHSVFDFNETPSRINGLLNNENLNNAGFMSGCTAVVALIKDDVVYVANAGDSRCVLSRSGKAVAMSIDHKPEDKSEKTRIIKAGGEITGGRINNGLNLSRSFGDHLYKRNTKLPQSEQMIIALPHVKMYKIRPKRDNFMVLACDGIWNCMNNQKVIDFVSKRLKAKQKLTKICEEMFSHCISPERPIDGRVGDDNMTCLIVTFYPVHS